MLTFKVSESTTGLEHELNRFKYIFVVRAFENALNVPVKLYCGDREVEIRYRIGDASRNQIMVIQYALLVKLCPPATHKLIHMLKP